MVWHFIGVYVINRTLSRLEIRNFSSPVEKNISLVRCAHSWKYFSTLEEKFRISARPCNILYTSPSPSTSLTGFLALCSNLLLFITRSKETSLINSALLASYSIDLFLTIFNGFPKNKVPEFKSTNNTNQYIKDPLPLILKHKIKKYQ